MKSLNWNGLYANKFKKIGLIFTAIFIILDIIGKVSGMDDSTIFIGPVYILILSLMIAIFSKEKIEDERIQVIRYFALKQTFSIVIVTVLFSIPLTKIFHSNFSYYCIIVPMLCYFPIFELANYYNPNFIFKEQTSNKTSEQIMQMTLSMGVVISIIALIIHFLK